MNAPIVSVAYHGGIAVISVNNPPVNTINAAVRAGLLQAVEEMRGRSGVNAAVLLCEGSTFFSGADIGEFSGPPKEEEYRHLFAQIEQLSQARIFESELLDLAGAQRLCDEFLAGRLLAGPGLAQRGEITAAVLRRTHRLQGQPLHGVKHRRHGRADRLGDPETQVGHHQKQGQGAEKHQLGQGRRPLFEERGRCAVQGS